MPHKESNTEFLPHYINELTTKNLCKCFQELKIVHQITEHCQAKIEQAKYFRSTREWRMTIKQLIDRIEALVYRLWWHF